MTEAKPSNTITQPLNQNLFSNPTLADSLEEIRITGGEPLMAPSVWKLFEWFKDNPEDKKESDPMAGMGGMF